ncbi:hypothetical protein AMTRI_Chr01g105420 [Amborella trichopoda]
MSAAKSYFTRTVRYLILVFLVSSSLFFLFDFKLLKVTFFSDSMDERRGREETQWFNASGDKEAQKSDSTGYLDHMPNILGDKAAYKSASPWNKSYPYTKRSKNIHINSVILAMKSAFFRKLFSYGIPVTKQGDATVEVAFMELFKNMYYGCLSKTSAPELLDVLFIANKFEVVSCKDHCSILLRNHHMNLETALLCFEPTLENAIDPLVDVAKQYLVDRYKEFTQYQDELMTFPFGGIKVVYDFVHNWARAKYPTLKERRKFLQSHITDLVCFPNMTTSKLKDMLNCNDMDRNYVLDVVHTAYLFKARGPRIHCNLMTTRAYKIRPKKEAELGSPPMLVLSFELKQKECARLFTCRRIYSGGFFLGGKEFYLMAISQKHNRSSSSSESFALYLGMVKDMRVTVDFEAFWGMSDDLNFSSNAKATLNFKGLDKEFLGFDNLFGIPWSSLMGEESPYFSNGVVRLTVVLTIRS